MLIQIEITLLSRVEMSTNAASHLVYHLVRPTVRGRGLDSCNEAVEARVIDNVVADANGGW